ncbi:hypothetical protein ACOSQ2_028508 [Xanthoceras sorbifolium]
MFTEDRTANKVPFGPFARESPPDFYSELKSNACTPPELGQEERTGKMAEFEQLNLARGNGCEQGGQLKVNRTFQSGLLPFINFVYSREVLTSSELPRASPVTGSYENVVHMLRCRRLAGKRTGK